MSQNREILARMFAMAAVEHAKSGPRPSPVEQLMVAVEEAIDDARRRRDLVEAGTQAYLLLNEQIVRWEAARRSNR